MLKKENIGILQMIACAVLWSIAGIFIKLLPWNGLSVASLRSLVAGVTIAVYMGIKHYPITVNWRTFLAGFFAGTTYVCFAVANKWTTAANAIVLQFTAPVFILIYASLFFKKKLRRPDLAVVLIALAGIALFFLDQLGPSTIIGNLVAIAAGMLLAGMYVAVERLTLQERFSAILIGQAVAFLIGLPVVIATRPLLNASTVSFILILGVFQLGIAYILYVKASQTCPALACCLLGAVEPLLNPVWVLLFTGERPGLFALAGGLIVILAVTVWCIWDVNEKNKYI